MVPTKQCTKNTSARPHLLATLEGLIKRRLFMFVTRNPIFQWLGSIHDVWNLRHIQLFDMGYGRVGVAGKWMDDGPATGRNRYRDFADAFIFDLRTTSKRNLQLALWQRLESRRKALLA